MGTSDIKQQVKHGSMIKQNYDKMMMEIGKKESKSTIQFQDHKICQLNYDALESQIKKFEKYPFK